MSSSKNNLIAKNTMMLYIRLSIIMIVYLYTSRIVLKALGIEDYGIYNVVAGVVTLFSFFNAALSSATSRFITYELGRENVIELKKNFRTAFTIHLILAVIILVLAETIGLWFVNNKLIIPVERLFAANMIFQFSILSCVVTIMQVPLNAEIIAHEKMGIYAYMGILDAACKLLIAFIISTCSYDKLVVYGFLLFLMTGFLFLVYHIYCKKKFNEYNPKPFYDKDTFRNMLSYSCWSLWGSMAYVLKDQGVNMVLNIFFGPIVNAARGITNQVNTALNGFTQNFTMAMNPQIVKSYACEDFNRMFLLLFSGAKFSYFLLLLFSIPIVLETEYILAIWLGQVPEYTVLFIRLIIINSLIESFTYVIGATVQATGNIRLYQIMVGGLLLLNLPISYVFLKLGYPPYVTFLIAILLSTISIVIRVIILNSLIKISIKQFTVNVLGVSVIVSLLSFILPYWIHCSMNEGFVRLICVAVGSIFCIFINAWFIGLNQKEKIFVKSSIIKKIVNRVYGKK